MTFEALSKELKAGKYKPVYLLHGNEPYYIDLITDHFEHKVLDEAERSFNMTILYGKDVDYKSVVDQARRYPMMAEHQVVILKEAQSMKQLTDLEAYIKNPLDTTIFVIAYKHGKLDGRTKFAKTLQKTAVVFESKRPYDNQMPAWIATFMQKKGYKINPAESSLIAEYLGNDLSKVANELSKLVINLPKGETINKDHIQEHIGISKDYNIFELQNALGTRNKVSTYKIIQYFQANPRNNPLVMVVATLFSYFNKIYLMQFLRNAPDREVQKTLGLSTSYFVKDYRTAAKNYNRLQTERILHLLRQYDLKSKGVDRGSFTDQSLMQEMIYQILST